MTMPGVGMLDSISAFRFKPDQWLWCLHCERFFQGRDARADGTGGMQACAFEHCDGAGHGVDIFEWNVWPAGMPALRAHWPREEELHKGLVAPAWPFEAAEVLDVTEADCARLGIGVALNGDWKRRDEILGTFTRDDVDDVTPFRNLDLARFELLVEERFITLDSEIDGHPAPRRPLEFMRRWPEMHAGGYSVHPDRPDYRVTITSLECEIDTVAKEDRDSLVAEFIAEFHEFGELVCMEDYLLVSWE